MSRPSSYRFRNMKSMMNSILVMSLLGMLNGAVIPQGGWWSLSYVAEYLPPIILVPRFMLSLRALFARNVQGRRGSDVDAAFGLSSGSVHAAASTIVFADSGQNEELEHHEEMQMVERTGEDHGAGTNY